MAPAAARIAQPATRDNAMPAAEGPTSVTVPYDALETELLLASQMRSLDIVRRAYAHDVRGPLNAMQLSVELLCGLLLDVGAGEAPGGTAAWQRHVSVLREELAKLNRTLQSLLDQELPLDSVRRRFEPVSLVREVAAALRGQAARQRVAIGVETFEQQLMVDGCRERVKQALLNMALHGLEGSPDGGRCTIGASRAGESCTLYVIHGGPPLTQQAAALLEQLQPVARDGRLLAGLCAARLVALSHGGDLVIEAAEGGAERLGLVLKCAVAAEQAAASAPGE
jgi:signal transduction histidine kinase